MPSKLDINTTEIPIDPNVTAPKHIHFSQQSTDDRSS